MAPRPLDQESVFYTSSWTRAVEDKFIDLLLDEYFVGNYKVDGNSSGAIRTAMRGINSQFNTNFDYMTCWMRVRKLKNRFRVFSWLIHVSGVHHNETTHQINCDPEMWEHICQKERLAAAYMEQGEKKYDELKYLFQEGPHPAEEALPKVIEISSDNENHRDIVLAQRRLFAEPTENEFWNELADVGEDGFDIGSDSEVNQPSVNSTTERKEAKMTKLTKKTNYGPGHGCEGSSTASYSPFKKV